MAKITLSEPNGPYECSIDSVVMDVNIREAYKAVEFLTSDQEELDVFMRDTGYELVYNSPQTDERVIVRLVNGDVYVNERRLFIAPDKVKRDV